MNLVTVTCEKDFSQFSLQVESIAKYCKNFFHYVIICEQSNYDRSKWETLLKKYYPDNFKLFAPRWNEHFDSQLMDGYGGWAKQQVFKFWIYQHIDADYIILDSKNFFIKYTDHSNFENIIGCGIIEKIREIIPDPYNVPFTWHNTIKKYAEINNVESLEYVLSAQTPFVFKKEILDKLGNIDNFCKKFSEIETIPSEIIYYSYLIDRKKISNGLSDSPLGFLPIHHNFFRNIDNFHDCVKNKHVIGIHRQILSKHKLFINNYLEQHNFKNKL